MTKQNETIIVEELTHTLAEVKTDMQLMRSMSESFPKLGDIEADELEMNYYRAKQTFGILFDKFQHLEYKLAQVMEELNK